MILIFGASCSKNFHRDELVTATPLKLRASTIFKSNKLYKQLFESVGYHNTPFPTTEDLPPHPFPSYFPKQDEQTRRLILLLRRRRRRTTRPLNPLNNAQPFLHRFQLLLLSPNLLRLPNEEGTRSLDNRSDSTLLPASLVRA